jgi:hypothetical protein
MTSRITLVALLVVLSAAAACRTPATGRPVVDTGAKPPAANGTIAGHVRAEGGAPVVSRLVKAVSLEDGQQYETSTNSAGTYSLKVPPGRYRLEVQLRQGERLVRQPGETKINTSDLDPGRDFEITTSG